MFTDIVIMAGGSGTRLWPASNSKKPKQFLSLPGGSTFFGASLERALRLLETDADDTTGRVVIVAGTTHVAHILNATAGLPRRKRERVIIVPEPIARNTAPAIACAAVFLRRAFGPGRRALVLTSDHVIGPFEAFRADAAAADALAAENRLAIFGIPPRGPETGFGYIEAGAPLGARSFVVASFREKPDQKTAEDFLASGRFTWNSGMFGFSADFMLEQFRMHAPRTLAPFETLSAPSADAYDDHGGARVLTRWEGLEAAYRSVEPISIDYAVAEKCASAAVVAASFDWIDIGSWDDYARFMEAAAVASAPDAAPDVAATSVFPIDAAGCWVDSDIPVAVCGVDDLLVVVRSGKDGTPPAVLICKRGESQKVKNAVEAIKSAGRTDVL